MTSDDLGAVANRIVARLVIEHPGLARLVLTAMERNAFGEHSLLEG